MNRHTLYATHTYGHRSSGLFNRYKYPAVSVDQRSGPERLINTVCPLSLEQKEFELSPTLDPFPASNKAERAGVTRYGVRLDPPPPPPTTHTHTHTLHPLSAPTTSSLAELHAQISARLSLCHLHAESLQCGVAGSCCAPRTGGFSSNGVY